MAVRLLRGNDLSSISNTRKPSGGQSTSTTASPRLEKTTPKKTRKKKEVRETKTKMDRVGEKSPSNSRGHFVPSPPTSPWKSGKIIATVLTVRVCIVISCGSACSNVPHIPVIPLHARTHRLYKFLRDRRTGYRRQPFPATRPSSHTAKEMATVLVCQSRRPSCLQQG